MLTEGSLVERLHQMANLLHHKPLATRREAERALLLQELQELEMQFVEEWVRAEKV
jgi:hypothetical protein